MIGGVRPRLVSAPRAKSNTLLLHAGTLYRADCGRRAASVAISLGSLLCRLVSLAASRLMIDTAAAHPPHVAPHMQHHPSPRLRLYADGGSGRGVVDLSQCLVFHNVCGGMF
jgi:hypothetical protein